MKLIIWVLWPAFIAAGIAETVFFAVIDPQQLYFFGRAINLPAVATYSLGFLLFWLLCACACLLTWFMLPPALKRAVDRELGSQQPAAKSRITDDIVP